MKKILFALILGALLLPAAVYAKSNSIPSTNATMPISKPVTPSANATMASSSKPAAPSANATMATSGKIATPSANATMPATAKPATPSTNATAPVKK